MDRRRTLVALVVAALSLLLAMGTVAAQSENRDLIDGLEYQLLYVALPLTLFVLLILVYAAVKFHDNDDPQPTTEDPALEITWTVATALILLFVGLSGYSVLVNPYVSPSQALEGEDTSQDGFDSFADLPDTDDEEVHVRGYQWEWQATYPEANVTTESEIVIPADTDVTFWLTSDDVVHSLFVPDLGVKQDAFPGDYTRARTTVSEPGRYDAVCAEFCGAGHSRMDGSIVVVERDTYDEWLAANEGTITDAPDPG
ncbi:cytochrome c oxidase subunit II [Natrinema thermotolerans]|uniref:cytochrome-c oxidase n=1 Tax=Natrinema thermotolerans TaxID=121872 RepID=A0AAF0PBZ5_9EURY|nr:cytochrome c oxidase subunit II [Natrinema thermotolerans]QCC60670.1 cytochrome c oxidase subunit II [Natrinema thermotolerans]QCC61555.1 cytochrome c oxidase subunit II [Natrinema thermotolerans]WMT07714.1 cytochrome c oxidase subunit II [Natrinema thermotolerans]WMT08346.1 cytochrome c oxidase subunit II [Natrinema thermotolerans]